MATTPRSDEYKRPMTAQESVLRELRRLIAELELRPGDRIRQDDLANRLGVSRIPIREALRVLAAEGRLRYEPHRGYSVQELTLDDLEEIHVLLRLLESEALRRAVLNIDDAALRTLDATVKELASQPVQGSPLRFMEVNQQFRFLLFGESRMPRLLDLIRVVWQSSDPYRLTLVSQARSRRRSVREYRAVLAAVRRKDIDGALEAMDRHRAENVDDIAAIIEGRVTD